MSTCLSGILRPRWGLRHTQILSFVVTNGTSFTPCRRFGQPASQTHPHMLQQGEVTPGITKEEYHARRLKLMKLIMQSADLQKHNHLVIIPSAAKLYMTNDIPYTFRQNTDFLYFCGFQEPDSVLVLSANHQSLPHYKSVLFVPRKDPAKELWDGARSGIDGALELTGVDEAYNFEQIETYLFKYLTENDNFVTWYDYLKPANQTLHVNILGRFLGQKKHKSLEQLKRFFHDTRVLKSTVEIELMKASAEISSEAFVEVMKFCKPNVNEAHLYAKMDFECRLRDAEYLAYVPVVAGGNRANTIHYISNNQIVHDGEMVLMDAGCEYHGYASDITRTFPVSGKFSKEQRDIYDAVLTVQKGCIDMCYRDTSLDNMYREMLTHIGIHLQRLGILPRNLGGTQLFNEARQFCPHHVGHYLGMDIHDTDTVPRNISLQNNMVITIEPGIYLPRSNKAIPEKYRGIGIRIEDDVHITSRGPVVLTANCPKDPDHIEDIMNRKAA